MMRRQTLQISAGFTAPWLGGRNGEDISRTCSRAQNASAYAYLTHADRVHGVLLWSACGDALGATVENYSLEKIASAHPHGLLTYSQAEHEIGTYTDDTQMAIALAGSLVAVGRLEPAHVSHAYGQDYEPHRGYSDTTQKILRELQQGTGDWRTIGTKYTLQGSQANGGAMRICPLGLAYRRASPAVLRAAVEGAVFATHRHPEGIDGAVVMAAAVAWLCQHCLPSDPSQAGVQAGGQARPEGAGLPSASGLTLEQQHMQALLQHLLLHAHTSEMQWRLQKLLHSVVSNPAVPRRDAPDAPSLKTFWSNHLWSEAWKAELKLQRSLSSDPCQMRAVDAVACALCAFVHHHGAGAHAVVAAIHYGGDTDTIACMAGGLVGAAHGSAWLPVDWYEGLENDHPKGRDGVVSLAQKLAALDVVD